MPDNSQPDKKAESKSAKEPKGFGRSFTASVVEDPSRPPPVWVFSGYAGTSDHKGRRRLYLTLDLSQWIDFPEDALIHSYDLAEHGQLPGTVVVWLRQGSQLWPSYQGSAGY